ncbi:IS481 family transposase [Pelagibius sp. Alg239-R121]|uniref:IS481 family transposase n=1 Tax=Pelagibius sp. Alg239-R121 TaxID=2993448 RepID=UPI0024A6AAD9|nr:IS481 family transposase [Pelagibius sp. Alg239-R121]
MLQNNQKVIRHKVGLLNLAEELGNVSRACQVMGLSRDTFYRYRDAVEEGGVEALLERTRRVPNPRNRVDIEIENAVIDYALEYPAHGQVRVSNELRKLGVFVSPSGVRSIWLRNDLANFKKRLKALKAKVAQAKLYKTKTPITAADMLNDKVLAFYEQHDLPVLRILTDRGTEYCGRADRHDYQLFLAINDIEHNKTKVKSPQTNGICERFHKTILQEFYQVTFRRKIYETIEQLQNDLDEWIDYYNNDRTHQGKICEGRTPMQTLVEGKTVWKEKFVDQT